MAKKTLTSGLLGTVTGLSKEAESVSTNSAVAPVEMPKEVVPEICLLYTSDAADD